MQTTTTTTTTWHYAAGGPRPGVWSARVRDDAGREGAVGLRWTGESPRRALPVGPVIDADGCILDRRPVVG
jgi:hypothetical protein